MPETKMTQDDWDRIFDQYRQRIKKKDADRIKGFEDAEIKDGTTLYRFVEDLFKSTVDGDIPGMLAQMSKLRRHVEEEEPAVVAKDVMEYVSQTTGTFNLRDVYAHLRASTQGQRKAIWAALHRMKARGEVESVGRKNGDYRKIDRSADKIDWMNAPTDTVPLKWPFDIQELVDLFPRNIVVIGGESNQGKTAVLLNLAKMNQDEFKVHYFSSEVGPTELRKRLLMFEDMKPEDWKFEAYDRSDNWADVIRPDDINIIDFLELHENHYLVGKYLHEIWEKLGKGLAIIAIQKAPYKELGAGGAAGLEKARLYMLIQAGFISIRKAKNWHTAQNPNGLVHQFKLVGGWKIIPQGVWHPEYEGEKKKKAWVI